LKKYSFFKSKYERNRLFWLERVGHFPPTEAERLEFIHELEDLTIRWKTATELIDRMYL